MGKLSNKQKQKLIENIDNVGVGVFVVDKGGDLYEAAKAKGFDLYEAVKEKAADFINRVPEEESVDASEINLEEGTEKNE